MATRNGKARKEIYLSPQEQLTIKLLAIRFNIDHTSMIRILLQLGIESLPYPAHNAASNVPAAPPGTIKLL